MRRKRVREQAFRTLFMIDIGKNNPEKALFYTIDNFTFSAGEQLFLKELVLGTLEKLPELDSLLSRYLINWEIERLAAPVRNILRLGLFELLFSEKTPPAVVINEAIELTKRYQDEEAARFVNGVLDKIRLETQIPK
ncbi:MAG: transcription antitermination factor NusB [Firmicutes bacterium]|nr:transcription antitermination factor NusB [Bacillota bacterium]